MFALVDGNNFYVSCEKVFNPSLEGKPVIVLSNNDGCIISRSNEAKALGIKMAEPVFKRIDIIKQYNVAVFSSNYTLYGDMSNRMMKTLQTFSPEIEIYSIDEAFLNLQGIACDYKKYGNQIREMVLKHIGIPVGVGIASTKTLAKLANKIAKKQDGVFVIDSEQTRLWALRCTPVGDVWGIGRQYAQKLQSMGVVTAYDFTLFSNEWIRRNLSIVGLRVKNELEGLANIPIQSLIEPKKSIATTRSFGKKLSDFGIISEAVSNHAVRCAEKLRYQKSISQFVTVFIHTDPFSETEKYIYKTFTIPLEVASNSNNAIVHAALSGLKKIYQKGLLYKKAGVIVSGIVNETHVQGNLFDDPNHSRYKDISKIADQLNQRFGRDSVKLAVQGNSPEWKLKQQRLAPRYTTRWDELLKVKAKE
jgi:DNA polymerase V